MPRGAGGSLDRARWGDPFGALSGDPGDAIKIGVVVEDDQVLGFRGSRDQQIGHLSSMLVPRRQKSLYLPRAANVVRRRLDEFEQVEGSRQPIPFGCAVC